VSASLPITAPGTINFRAKTLLLLTAVLVRTPAFVVFLLGSLRGEAAAVFIELESGSFWSFDSCLASGLIRVGGITQGKPCEPGTKCLGPKGRAPKGLEDSAQGFNPGNRRPKAICPDGAADRTY
jgi:hypothetical protein